MRTTPRRRRRFAAAVVTVVASAGLLGGCTGIPGVPQVVIGVPGSHTFTKGVLFDGTKTPAGGTLAFCVSEPMRVVVTTSATAQVDVEFGGDAWGNFGLPPETDVVTDVIGPGCGKVSAFESSFIPTKLTVGLSRLDP